MIITRDLPTQLPVSRPQEAQGLQTVRDVALRCLKELVVSLAIGAVVGCFVSPIGLSCMLGATLIQSTVSLIFHSLGAFTSYKESCEWITSLSFAYFTGYNAQTLIHESGHALASLAVYANPRPTIEIYPFIGALTEFYKTKLSAFGKRIGPAAATCFVIASGPALTLLVSSIILIVGLAIRKTHPALSKYMITCSLLDFVIHAKYAYSALSANSWYLNHDFVHLSIFGLHPLVATIGILAIPILIIGGMMWRETAQTRALGSH